MTNKNDSAEKVRIRIYRQKLDPLNPTAPPAVYEIGTLDDGGVIIKKDSGPMKANTVPATERRCE